jgi:hypothetical protein
MFRNQSADVIRKVKSNAKDKGTVPSELNMLVQSTVTSDGEIDGLELEDAFISVSRQHFELPVPLLPTISSYVMTPTVEQHARGFFQAHSQLWLRNTDLLDKMISQNDEDEHLLASMYAVGLASLSNYLHSDQLMAQAREGYVCALRLTNAALKSPSEAKKDSTLFSIMILGVYETIAGNTARSVVTWESHVKGAIALVEYRGLEQFNTDAGQRLFFQVMSNMLIICIQRTMPMPPRIVELRNAAEQIIQSSRAIWNLSGIMIDVTILRADIKVGRLVQPSAIIQRALSIDKRFEIAFSDPPLEWQYTVEHTDDRPDLVWNKISHKFPQPWVLQV